MGLAPKIVDEIFEFLAPPRRHGVALLLVEQYVQQALARGRLRLRLAQGPVAFAGEPSELDADALAHQYLGV